MLQNIAWQAPALDQHKINSSEPSAVGKLARLFQRYALEAGVGQRQELVFVCIGSDRSTGDSLGPLVGTTLAGTPSSRVRVYGTLEEPVHAANLGEVLSVIARAHADPLITAVDACLGRPENVGFITIGKGPLKPGAGVHKTLPPVGQLFVTGTVNIGGFMEYFVLQNTRLSLVMKMAHVTALGLQSGVRLLLAESLP